MDMAAKQPRKERSANSDVVLITEETVESGGTQLKMNPATTEEARVTTKGKGEMMEEEEITCLGETGAQVDSGGQTGGSRECTASSPEKKAQRDQSKLARKLSRNESEKQRRDRLNMYIADLAKSVPLAVSANHKLDKSGILRLTVNYLKIHQNLRKQKKAGRCSTWRPDFLPSDLEGILLESMNGFLFVAGKKCTLIFVCENITKLLGHNRSQVMGQSMLNIIHSDDHDAFKTQFICKDNPDFSSMLSAHRKHNFSLPASNHRFFCVKMLNVNGRQSNYETVQIVGHLSLKQAAQRDLPPELCLVGVGRLVSQQEIRELTVTDSDPTRWITRHNMDGKITFSDQRAAWLTGFFPEESIGMSPYSLLHPSDVKYVVLSHNRFLATGDIPSTVFRIFTKSREVLYIMSSTHMVLSQWTNKPLYIISIQDVLKASDGKRMLKEQKRQLLALEAAKKMFPQRGASGDSMQAVPSVSTQEDDEDNQETNPCNGGLTIPGAVEAGKDKVEVVVGKDKFEIDLTKQEEFVSSKRKKADIKSVFEHTDKKVVVPDAKKPEFLGRSHRWSTNSSDFSSPPCSPTDSSCDSSYNKALDTTDSPDSSSENVSTGSWQSPDSSTIHSQGTPELDYKLILSLLSTVSTSSGSDMMDSIPTQAEMQVDICDQVATRTSGFSPDSQGLTVEGSTEMEAESEIQMSNGSLTPSLLQETVEKVDQIQTNMDQIKTNIENLTKAMNFGNCSASEFLSQWSHEVLGQRPDFHQKFRDQLKQKHVTLESKINKQCAEIKQIKTQLQQLGLPGYSPMIEASLQKLIELEAECQQQSDQLQQLQADCSIPADQQGAPEATSSDQGHIQAYMGTNGLHSVSSSVPFFTSIDTESNLSDLKLSNKSLMSHLSLPNYDMSSSQLPGEEIFTNTCQSSEVCSSSSQSVGIPPFPDTEPFSPGSQAAYLPQTNGHSPEHMQLKFYGKNGAQLQQGVMSHSQTVLAEGQYGMGNSFEMSYTHVPSPEYLNLDTYEGHSNACIPSTQGACPGDSSFLFQEIEIDGTGNNPLPYHNLVNVSNRNGFSRDSEGLMRQGTMLGQK